MSELHRYRRSASGELWSENSSGSPKMSPQPVMCMKRVTLLCFFSLTFMR